MSRGTGQLIKNLKQFTDLQYKHFTNRYGQQLIDIFEFPIKLVLSPITLAYDIAGSAPRGFGVPEFISKLSYSTIFQFTDLQYKHFTNFYGQQLIDIVEFPIKLVLSPITLAYDIAGSAPRGEGEMEGDYNVGIRTLTNKVKVQVVATLGTYDIAMELGKKVICQRCRTAGHAVDGRRCNAQCAKVQARGEKATAESIADAIADNRAELVHLPSTVDLHVPLPSKDCPSCDGSGVMKCPECKDKLQVRISADDIMEPPWKAYNIMRKMDYPYEASAMSSLFLFFFNESLLAIIWGHIVDSMKDPSIAAFWLLTLPQIVGGFEYDDDVKKNIWWQYKESMRYDQLRDVVAKRKPGWEYLQEALVSIDPTRAREDPVVVKNIPYFKAKKALEAEVMKLDPPSRPRNWGELNLPLDASSWSEKDLKDPKKLYEMTVLLNAQREIAEKMLDAQWEANDFTEVQICILSLLVCAFKFEPGHVSGMQMTGNALNKMLEEKVRPYIQNIGNTVLPQPIVMESERNQDQKGNGFRIT
ncbi:hypothetical protein RND71_037166 [Anisodus tanguticus]|uniref:AtTam37 zinc finger domain-containing protein n=1 Tax=Anisodus tanguticus TaxID=243964 RepID=A0AAE1R5E2_9SOLA|nr:hypothetical protein RND71_037166 [Anisodus tanguticus]